MSSSMAEYKVRAAALRRRSAARREAYNALGALIGRSLVEGEPTDEVAGSERLEDALDRAAAAVRAAEPRDVAFAVALIGFRLVDRADSRTDKRKFGLQLIAGGAPARQRIRAGHLELV